MQWFFVSHFLQSWLLPPGINCLLGIIGLATWRSCPKLSKALLALAILSLWLLSTPIFGLQLMKILQNKYPPLQISSQIPIHEKAAIVILGGGHGNAPEYEDGNNLSKESLLRLTYGIYLAQKLELPIVVSGGKTNHLDYSEAEIMAHRIYLNNQIWRDDDSNNTQEEVKNVLAILQKQGIQKIYLVTNAWHMPRAMQLFKNIYDDKQIKVIAAPTGIDVWQKDMGILNFAPNPTTLIASYDALHEFYGMLCYYLKAMIVLRKEAR